MGSLPHGRVSLPVWHRERALSRVKCATWRDGSRPRWRGGRARPGDRGDRRARTGGVWRSPPAGLVARSRGRWCGRGEGKAVEILGGDAGLEGTRRLVVGQDCTGQDTPSGRSFRRADRAVHRIERGIERWHARNEVGAPTAPENGAGIGSGSSLTRRPACTSWSGERTGEGSPGPSSTATGRRQSGRPTDEFAAGFAGPDLNGKAEAEPEPLTLGGLFDIYGEEVTPTKGEHTRQHDRTTMAMFLRFFGRNRDPATLSQRDWLDRPARGRSSSPTPTSSGSGVLRLPQLPAMQICGLFAR